MLGHFIFLGLFFAVLTAIAATLGLTAFRALRDFRARRVDAIAWHETFPDLPVADRACRHQFTGEFPGRVCDRAFDCRECQKHAGLVANQSAAPEAGPGRVEIFGLDVPLDRYYHRGHTWAHPEADGTVTIGLDPLGERLVNSPEAVTLPAVGAHIETNGTAWRVRKRGANVRILSPVDGEIVALGGPGDGWILRVMPDNGRFDARHLLRGTEIRPWITREFERLAETLSPAADALTMADGGVLVDDIAASYPHSDWDTVCAQIFLQA